MVCRKMPNIVVVNPRAMHFCESRATSIDLCVRDMVHYSRFKDTTTVIGDAVDRPFPGIRFRPRPVARPDTFYLRRSKLLRQIRDLAPDVVCVQEHLRTASYLARRLAVPVVLQKHNTIQAPKGELDRLLTRAHYNRLAALMFVSDSLRADFARSWPQVRARLQVVTNSLDTSLWSPSTERRKTILVVGRATPEKGIRQAALALARGSAATSGLAGAVHPQRSSRGRGLFCRSGGADRPPRTAGIAGRAAAAGRGEGGDGKRGDPAGAVGLQGAVRSRRPGGSCGRPGGDLVRYRRASRSQRRRGVVSAGGRARSHRLRA